MSRVGTFGLSLKSYDYFSEINLALGFAALASGKQVQGISFLRDRRWPWNTLRQMAMAMA
jgi:hypothetical protein